MRRLPARKGNVHHQRAATQSLLLTEAVARFHTQRPDSHLPRATAITSAVALNYLRRAHLLPKLPFSMHWERGVVNAFLGRAERLDSRRTARRRRAPKAPQLCPHP